LVLLEVAGGGGEASPSPPPPGSRRASTPRPLPPPPPPPPTDGGSGRPDEPPPRGAPLTGSGGDGASLLNHYARPAGGGPAGGVPAGGILVIHENRGLVTHIKDVVRRVATAGFSAIAIDLLSRQGGAERLSDPAEYAGVLSKQDPMAMVSDLRQALSALSAAGP